MVKILSSLLTFSSIVPSLLMKDALSSALYVALIVNCWILPIMISHKRYFLATHPKLQAIISKSLTHRLIISYRVRDLTNRFFNKFFYQLISKSEFNQQFSFFFQLSFFCFTYIYLLLLLVILYSQVLSGILVSGDCVILFVCVFCLYFT